ncbi:MAG: DUF3793 family protein [Faecousia sp.]
MSEEYLIRNCAPTLAGIKTANLFSCPYENKDTVIYDLRRINRKLSPKGLRALPLRFSEKNVLIYLYRPNLLNADLSDAGAAQILKRCGYDPANSAKCLVLLAKKLREQEEFPHEIGLFLGYPPEDVCGFMEGRPCPCKCQGCWRVYSNEASARETFRRYRVCNRVYHAQWAKGIDIERLTVAG